MDDNNIIKHYIEDEMPLLKISRMYATTHYTIRKILKKHNIPLRNKGTKLGSISPNKGVTFERESLRYTQELLESGEYKKLCEPAIRHHIKRWLITKNGHCCEICKNTTWMGKQIPLICDHIDGNHNNTELTNFRIVCPNCDAQLPTYKSKNRGNGRKYDREYYKTRRGG